MEALEAPTNVWSSAIQSGGVDSGGSHPCLSNLVVYTEDPQDEAPVVATIAQYLLHHPCRVILIIAEPRTATSKIEAKYSSHTYSDDGGRSVACDQFTIRAGGAAVKELASAIQPLLVADLPIHIWWRGIFLTQRNLVEQMFAFADRFIYDGVAWTNLHFTVMQVADFFSRYEEKVAFTNFNWARLRPWRECAADFFDAGVFEQEIWEIDHVRIAYMSLPGMEEGNQFRALLFAAWLVVQLEWQHVQSTPGLDLASMEFRDKKGNTVVLDLAMLPQSTASSQGLQQVVMTVDKPDWSQSFIVERDHNERMMILRHEDKKSKRLLRTFPHADSTTAALLYRELGRRVRNRVFEKSFKMASVLLQTI